MGPMWNRVGPSVPLYRPSPGRVQVLPSGQTPGGGHGDEAANTRRKQTEN